MPGAKKRKKFYTKFLSKTFDVTNFFLSSKLSAKNFGFTEEK